MVATLSVAVDDRVLRRAEEVLHQRAFTTVEIINIFMVRTAEDENCRSMRQFPTRKPNRPGSLPPLGAARHGLRGGSAE